MSNSVKTPKRPTLVPARPTLVFRVFYDPTTSKCINKSDGSAISELPYIEVDYATYSSIDVCSNFTVTSGRLERVKRPSKYKRIQLTDQGQFKTLKHNMIFVVGDNYNGAIDTWDFTI